MDQHEWVQGCQQYYTENYYEPGNPEDGEWHDCHYPVPECLGGTETVKLLKQHHAVQGVLQSEIYQYPCIFGWERDYLPDDYIPLFDKWRSELGRIGGLLGGAAGGTISRDQKLGMFALTREERQERNRKSWETQKQRKVGIHALSQEELLNHCSTAGMLGGARALELGVGVHGLTSEQRKEYGSKGATTTSSQRWRCTVTGKVAPPGPLTLYQRKRGIDPSKRERVR